MRIAPSVLLLTLVATGAFGADVYRSTDPNGNVSYSDRPQNDGAQPVTILTPHAGTPATAPRQTTVAAAKPAAPGAPGANPDALPPRPKTAAEKTKECEDAKTRATSFANSRRIYRTSANGERQYLDDKQIDEARAKSAADVKTFCG